MKKLAFSLLFTLFPFLVFAESGSLSFAPPASDVSVVFLGNIFGVVDGVLHGTGSQIMGTMFGVFNAAVLALGGIVIMYTLLVSTVNTAHEGEMLGRKWSSIWVPVRATLGLALLIPKASGYCLMQIFVMWVVVQGVGAADKVWAAALDYLNRGGVIIQQQINPMQSMSAGGWDIANGAASILYGQVCMLGLQTILTTQRQGYLTSLTKEGPPCFEATDPDIINFCNTPVPDFLSTVNTVAYQSTAAQPTTTTPFYEIPMPNFETGSIYNVLNGICGTIHWNPVNTSTLSSITTLSPSDLETASMSRAIAIQQMYNDLSMVTQVMVNNDPQLSPPVENSSVTMAFPPVANQQFGIPFTASGTVCPNNETLGDTSYGCISWGADTNGATSAVLFSGTEFQGAVADYNAIMLPTMNLISQSHDYSSANDQRAFIETADSQGWMLAGSYFFSLASINAASSTTSSTSTNRSAMDDTSGIQKSSSSISDVVNAFTPNCNGKYATLCTWFQGKNTKVLQLETLIDGVNSLGGNAMSPPNLPVSSTGIATPVQLSPETGVKSVTTYGFVNNSLLIQLPGQPGQAPPGFTMNIIPDIGKPPVGLPKIDPPCGTVKIIAPFSFCLIQFMVVAVYNYIVVPLFNFFLGLVIGVIDTLVMAFMALPLIGMYQIFSACVAFIENPNVNPVIALSNMGINYINFAANLWIYLLGLSIAAIFLGPFGIVIFVILAMSMPLLMAWLGTMVTVGFVTAYYIPFMPYMIFTFGSIAWLMAVIEAMVAAPIVALGITHPEGEGPFGKGEQAIMILMNVFLRPALMIIGYIAGIILSYVAVWVINAGFSNVLTFIQGNGSGASSSTGLFEGINRGFNFYNEATPGNQVQVTTGYTGWAGVYGFFFSVLIYTTMYVIMVQKSFTLITSLPDKVLRWIGGQPENIGQEAAQWGEESKKQVEGAGEKTNKAQQQVGKAATGYAMKGAEALQIPGAKMGASGDE